MSSALLPSVVEAAADVRTGTRTATELVGHCLEAIERLDPALNAWCHVAADAALDAAGRVDAAVARGEDPGPLAGVPFGVKDLEDCAGMPTTRGSRWFTGGPPAAQDDIHVGRLRAAGAIPLGKTTTPEFGAWAYTASPLLGVTRNPWDATRTPGGSSGGTAAAVSAAMVPFGTASDGGGSIRTPAAFCGLPGLRPCYGRIPTFGVTWYAQNAVVGALATTVADTALLLDVMAGPHARDRTSLPAPALRFADAIESLEVAGLRAAFSADLGFLVTDPVVATACEAAARALATAAELRLVERPVVLDDFIQPYVWMEGVDKFVGIPPELWQERLDELDPRTVDGWRVMQDATLPRLARREEQRRALVTQIADLFEDVDVLLMPSTAVPAFAAEGPMPTTIAGRAVHGGMAVEHQMLANLVNLPAMSVPAGLSPDGLPIGLQIVGPRHREELCLRLARIWERTRPWPRHAPPAAGSGM